jgi:hypothetical protein
MCCHVLHNVGSPAITTRQCAEIDANACKILHGRLIKLYVLSRHVWRILQIDQHAPEEGLTSEDRFMTSRASGVGIAVEK